MSNDMIERVAKALSTFDESNFPKFVKSDWEKLTPLARSAYRRRARAAIEAMREPTRMMIDAGASGCGEDSINVAMGAWDAMIDAALAEGESE